MSVRGTPVSCGREIPDTPVEVNNPETVEINGCRAAVLACDGWPDQGAVAAKIPRTQRSR